MIKKQKILGLILSIFLLAPWVLTEEEISIRVWLFQGKWMGDEPGLKQVEILSMSSHPQISSLKDKVAGPENELRAAVIEALLKIMELRTVDDLFSFSKPWNEKVFRLNEAVRLEKETFRFTFTPRRLSPQKVDLQTAVYRIAEIPAPRPKDKPRNEEWQKVLATGKGEDQKAKILDLELILEIGDPVIVGIPSEGQAYFMMVLLTSGAKTLGQADSLSKPKPSHKVIPAYPDELRQQGVEGKVELQVAIDEEGTVQGVRVVKPLHPYLDNAALQALKQWKFEPAQKNGKPISVLMTMAINFSREDYRILEETSEKKESLSRGLEPSSRAELRMILEQGAAYCQKLTDSALDYICEETIHDIFYNFHDKESMEKSTIVVTLVSGSDSLSTFGSSFVPFHDPKRTERNKYVCDYLLVKKGEKIEERRIILKENGRKVPDRQKLLEEKRFSTLIPLLAPVRLLEKDRQSLFDYRLLKRETVKGKKAYVIEALPKSGDAGGMEYGKIWVDQSNFQILKIEIESIPLEGYESILKEITRYGMKPKFTTTYLYQVEKKGILFPRSSTIRVGYPYPGEAGAFYLKKIKTDVDYEKYRFFTVETEHQIIK